ncbi:MAG: SDR family oxidoreductase [Deltaproteobacteria bacterium]|nr:SDR family oxidoreductase [Deltaproteobacteria bacterium]
MSKILVTGCSRGIGYDTALLLARAGHEVVATLRSPGSCDLAKRAVEERLPLTVEALDVDDDASVAAVFGRHADSINALVNNAGIYSIDAVEDESIERFQQVMQTNFFGAVRCVKQVLPAMRKRGSGCIVNVTSIAGRVAFFGQAAYSASKFALESFSESLAQEVAGHGIRVALVEPGIIDTAMATTSLPQYSPDTIYPHGRRVHAFFRNPDKPQAPADLVSRKIREVIEGQDARLRHPVGPDMLPLLGWRLSHSDEAWIRLGSLASDAEYNRQVLLDAGVDLHLD